MDNPAEKKKRHGRRILWIVIIVVVALFALRFWKLGQKESYASISSIQKTEGIPVEIAVAVMGNLESWTTLAGTIEGSFQYPVVSSNSIGVIDIAKKEGDRVKPGDVLIRLESTSPNAMLLSYPRSLAVYRDAVADAERMRNLYKEGAISKQALDKAELAVEVAKANLADAAGSTTLTASHAGVVASVNVEKGEMAAAYTPLMWIARTDSVKVNFEAGSRQAMVLKVGQKAVWNARMNGGSGIGIVSSVDLAADPESHLVSGEALFPNPEKMLMPGVVIPFNVLTGDRRGVVKIPTTCLIERNGVYRVFIVETGDGGKLFARLREVETGLRTTDEVEITSGLAAKARVVQFGQTLLSDGDRVRVVRGEEAQ
ncbi:MAG: efflux RND transporter periplasmic adaptor subunit [Candidatus Krumholzibacteria bacterium]|nr:efflux RND transporter periplasmic adaptor subunit [Candidatus Krumholzibacteria bacterium]